MCHLPKAMCHLSIYGQTHCFFLLHLDLFPWATAYEGKRHFCQGGVNATWDGSRLLGVEFHSYHENKFWMLEAQLPALRSRYAAVGGRFLTMSVFREPVAHTISWYRFYSYLGHSKAQAYPTLLEWLRGQKRQQSRGTRVNAVRGLQSARLAVLQSCALPATNASGTTVTAVQGNGTTSSCGSPTLSQWLLTCRPSEAVADELTTSLRHSFDLIGTTERLQDTFNEACKLFGNRPRRLTIVTPQSPSRRVLPNVSVLLSQQNASGLAALHDFTACDQTLYSVCLNLTGRVDGD